MTLRKSGTDVFTVRHDDHQMTLLMNGKAVGHLDWRPGGRVIRVDFVQVDPVFRGQGLGARLVEAAADHARRTGRRLVPICGYARRVLSSDPKYRDVLETAPWLGPDPLPPA